MIWARVLAYVTGTVNQELLLRNEYLAAENRILRAKIKGRETGNAAELVPKTHRQQVRRVEKSQIMGPSTD